MCLPCGFLFRELRHSSEPSFCSLNPLPIPSALSIAIYSDAHVSVQTTEHYLGCKQRIRSAVNDRIRIEPTPKALGDSGRFADYADASSENHASCRPARATFRIADHSPRSVVSTAHQSMRIRVWSCTVCPLHSDFSNRNREGQSDKQRVWGTR
jgi:hypothetical protein